MKNWGSQNHISAQIISILHNDERRFFTRCQSSVPGSKNCIQENHRPPCRWWWGVPHWQEDGGTCCAKPKGGAVVFITPIPSLLHRLIMTHSYLMVYLCMLEAVQVPEWCYWLWIHFSKLSTVPCVLFRSFPVQYNNWYRENVADRFEWTAYNTFWVAMTTVVIPLAIVNITIEQQR